MNHREHQSIPPTGALWKTWPARVIAGAATVFIAALVGYFVLILASPTDVTVGPLRVEFAIKPAWHGKSVVNLPPAGSLEADTHSGPAEITYSLEEIAITRVEELTDAGSQARRELMNWQEPVSNEVDSLLVRIAVLSAVAGGVVCALLRRSWQWAATGAAVALMAATLVGGVAYRTYDTAAFQEPRYNGNLSSAPDILAFSQQTLANLDSYEDRVPEIAESLFRTVSELHELPPVQPGDGSITVLHVSDMHASAAAANLTKSVVDLYGVDFVVDTGDSTDLGTPLESRYLTSYLPLTVPYLWVAGNHDSPTIAQTMKGINGVTVLEGGSTTIDGVQVQGFPDLSSTSISPAIAGDDRQAEYAQQIVRNVTSQATLPFLVAVHDPKQAAQLPGLVPVVLNGHTHRESIEVNKGTVYLDAGSTGGGGFRSFEQSGESPSTLHLLYIQKDPMKLEAVDTITIYGFSQEFSVARRVFGEEEGRLSLPGVRTPARIPVPR